jgi:YD repeat-containing protein
MTAAASAIAHPALAQDYEYDALGRLTKVTNADGAVVQYQYDAAGNRQNVTATLAAVVSVSDATAAEGGALVFTVTRSVNTSAAISLNYATSNGTATAPGDYTAASGVVSFAIGEATKTFSVNTVPDSLFETSETVNVTLSNPPAGVTIGDGAGIGTISDTSVAPSFSINDMSSGEGATLSFTITKSGSTTLSHNVTFQTANGSAIAGSDYAAQGPTTLTFAAGETTKSVAIATTQEAVYEANENFVVYLSAATGGATIGDSQGVGTINNDDAAPSFAINSASATEGQPVNFTVTRSGATSFSHAVSFATANGTALAPPDYTSSSGNVVFQPNETTKTLTVATIGENFFEPNETLTMSISGPTNGATISSATGTGTIVNDDANITYVRDDGGSIQPGYTETMTWSSKFGYIYRTKTAGGTTIHTSMDQSLGYCNTGIAPISGYSWTGNGCEMRVGP